MAGHKWDPDPDYQGHYSSDSYQRDRVYHQGTVWGWLLGAFVQAHLRVYRDPAIALTFLEPIANQLRFGCVGTLSEIFDGDPPLVSRGAFAQAWTVAEALRAWITGTTEVYNGVNRAIPSSESTILS